MKIKDISKIILAIIALWLVATSISDTFADLSKNDQIYSPAELEKSTIPFAPIEFSETESEEVDFALDMDKLSISIMELDELIQEIQLAIEGIEEASFTAESWNIFQVALIRAVEVLENENYDYDQIIALGNTLRNAFFELEFSDITETEITPDDQSEWEDVADEICNLEEDYEIVEQPEEEKREEIEEIEEIEEMGEEMEEKMEEEGQLMLLLDNATFETLTLSDLQQLAAEGGYAPVEVQYNRSRSNNYNACPNVLPDGGFSIGNIVDYDGIRTVCVETWNQFRAAYSITGTVGGLAPNGENVDRIILMDSMTTDGRSDTTRATSIEIDGNGRLPDGRPSGNGPDGDGFVLTQDGYASLNITATTTFGLFHLHSVVIGDRSIPSVAGSGGGASLVNGRTALRDTEVGPTWRFRFGDLRTANVVITERDDDERAISWQVNQENSGINRLVRGQRAEVTFYGEMFLNTRAENMYIGKVLIEDDTLYVGHINQWNFSLIWFSENFNTNSTAASTSCGTLTLPADWPEGTGTNQTDCRNSFVIGKNANVYWTSSSRGGSFPTVFTHWRNILILEDATLHASQNHPTFAFQENPGGSTDSTRMAQTIRVHKGAELMATRNADGEVIASSTAGTHGGGTGNARNATFEVLPGGSLFVIGANSNGPIVDMSGTNNQFKIDSPYRADLRNQHSNEHARIFERDSGATYTIENSHIILWENGENTGGIGEAPNWAGPINTSFPDHVYHHIAHFTITGGTSSGGTGNDILWGSNAAGTSGSNWSGITASNNHLQHLIRSNLRDTGTGSTGSANARRNIGRFRRIALTNENPVAQLLDAVTDADRSVRAQALLMEVPLSAGGGNDIVGLPIKWRPVIASSDQADIWIVDSFIEASEPQLMTINQNGVAIWTDPENRFQKAESEIEIWAEGNLVHNPWIQGFKTKTLVLDVTPPKPAEFESAPISTLDTLIIGTASEIGVGVIVEITGPSLPEGKLSLPAIIDHNGRWQVEIPARENQDICHINVLNADDQIQVLLYDRAPTLTNPTDFNYPLIHSGYRPSMPATHHGHIGEVQIGNQNPRTSPYNYRDALGEHAFMPGATLVVSECVVVTFEYNYQNAPDDGIFIQTGVTTGMTADAPSADPTRPGYKFIGWSTTAQTHDEFLFATTPITEPTTIYAQWIPLVDFNFTKTNQLLYTDFDQSEKLKNAEFSLYIWEKVKEAVVEDVEEENGENSKGEDVKYDWVIFANATSNLEGKVSFTDLVAGNRFKLVETSAPEDYRLPEGYWIVEIKTDRNVAIEWMRENDASARYDVSFINQNNQWFVGNYPLGREFSFTKTNDYVYFDPDVSKPAHPNLEFLPDAIFSLKRWEFVEAQNDYDWVVIEEDVESDLNGLVKFNHLLTLNQTYRLDETKAPSGFRRPHGWWVITWDEEKNRFNMIADGTVSLVPAFRIEVYPTEEEKEIGINYYLGNFPETILPRTGIGSMELTIIGILSIIFSILLYIRGKLVNDLIKLEDRLSKITIDAKKDC